jgi:hypothetical protein
LFRNEYGDGAVNGVDIRVDIVLAEFSRSVGVAVIFTVLPLLLKMSKITFGRFLDICA